MKKDNLSRINELARKSKTVGLNQEEIQERDKLRAQYVKEFRKSMESNLLDKIYIVDEQGNKTKINKKSKN